MSHSVVAEPCHTGVDVVERIDGAFQLTSFTDHLARYRFAMQWAPGAKVLDVCCGVGYGSLILSTAGALQVHGVDIDEEAIAVAHTQSVMPNLTFSVGNACESLPERGKWDLITCFEGIEHVPDPDALLENIYNALTPCGVAVVSSPNSDAFRGGHSGNQFHISEMTEAEFRACIARQPWKTEWYAQIDRDSVWHRPAWQRNLIRKMPEWLRKRRPTVKEVAPGRSVKALMNPTPIKTDDWYPMSWERAVSIMYTPSIPEIIVTVCRKSSSTK